MILAVIVTCKLWPKLGQGRLSEIATELGQVPSRRVTTNSVPVLPRLSFMVILSGGVTLSLISISFGCTT